MYHIRFFTAISPFLFLDYVQIHTVLAQNLRGRKETILQDIQKIDPIQCGIVGNMLETSNSEENHFSKAMDIETILRMSNEMSKDDAFSCFHHYFISLGDTLRFSKDKFIYPTFVEGEYLGEMIWFHGSKALASILNAGWKGIKCVQSTSSNEKNEENEKKIKCVITNEIPNVPSVSSYNYSSISTENGAVTYESACFPIDPASPCYKIDFINRHFYARPISNTDFIVFAYSNDMNDPSSFSFSDVNVMHGIGTRSLNNTFQHST